MVLVFCINNKTKQGKEHHIFLEKLILTYLDSPLLIKLKWTFQDKENLYFIMEYVNRGELATFISKKGYLLKSWIILVVLLFIRIEIIFNIKYFDFFQNFNI